MRKQIAVFMMVCTLAGCESSGVAVVGKEELAIADAPYGKTIDKAAPGSVLPVMSAWLEIALDGGMGWIPEAEVRRIAAPELGSGAAPAAPALAVASAPGAAGAASPARGASSSASAAAPATIPAAAPAAKPAAAQAPSRSKVVSEEPAEATKDSDDTTEDEGQIEVKNADLRADLDGDGHLETIQTRASTKEGVRIQVRNGATREWHDLSIDVEGEMLAGVDVSLLPKSEAGIPLLEVSIQLSGCSGSTTAHYLSYVRGELKKALEVEESVETAGSGSVTSKVRFDARRRTATVTTVSDMRDNPYAESAAEKKLTKARDRYKLADGVFVPMTAKPKRRR